MRLLEHLLYASIVALAAFCVGWDGGASAQTFAQFSDGLTIQPYGITAGPDGNVWFTSASSDRVGRITPDGAITEFAAGITPNADLHAITTGPDGNLWFTEIGTRKIGRITPIGVVTEFTGGISPDAYLMGIVAGPDGNLWFTEMVGQRIGRITPSGVVTEFTADPLWPREIAVGPDGNLWFTSQWSGGIGRITPFGEITIIAPDIGASHITAGSDGNMWFTGFSGFIGRITPPGAVTIFSLGISADAGPFGIAAGADGNIWFTEIGIGRIGRITPLGEVTEFSTGIDPAVGLWEIASGPDGNLWFGTTKQMVRLTTGTPIAARRVIEFYHAQFDHYFVTWMPSEIAKLDAGLEIRGWTRTGYEFKSLSGPSSGSSPVCRYYIPPTLGNSHFLGRGTGECIATGGSHPDFVLEDPIFMQMQLPFAGTCPIRTTPVYRVFSNRPDANHRYMTDKAVRDQMVAKGWLAEGDGPDLVVMCAPQ